MRYLKAASFFALAVAGILFGISNQDNATVHFFWYFSKSYPLYLVLFACFLAGTVIAILYGFISGGDMNDKERRSKKYLEDLKGRLMKAQAGKAPFTPPGSVDGSPGRTP